MLYKTIVLEMLQEQYPKHHERLRLRRKLLQAVETYAVELRQAHLRWLAQGMDANSARELALEELQKALARDASDLET